MVGRQFRGRSRRRARPRRSGSRARREVRRDRRTQPSDARSTRPGLAAARDARSPPLCTAATARTHSHSRPSRDNKRLVNDANRTMQTDVTHAIFHRAICRTSARLYRATKSQTLRLSSCTLRLCRIDKNTASAPLFRFTILLQKHSSRMIKFSISKSNLFWTLRLIVEHRTLSFCRTAY